MVFLNSRWLNELRHCRGQCWPGVKCLRFGGAKKAVKVSINMASPSAPWASAWKAWLCRLAAVNRPVILTSMVAYSALLVYRNKKNPTRTTAIGVRFCSLHTSSLLVAFTEPNPVICHSTGTVHLPSESWYVFVPDVASSLQVAHSRRLTHTPCIRETAAEGTMAAVKKMKLITPQLLSAIITHHDMCTRQRLIHRNYSKQTISQSLKKLLEKNVASWTPCQHDEWLVMRNPVLELRVPLVARSTTKRTVYMNCLW